MFQISESFPEGNICDAMLCHPALRDNLKKYIPQTGLAVMYLHSQGIVHRNVKLENFLVCNQSTVCVPFTGCLNMTQRIVHVTYVQPAGTSLGGGGGVTPPFHYLFRGTLHRFEKYMVTRNSISLIVVEFCVVHNAYF